MKNVTKKQFAKLVIDVSHLKRIHLKWDMLTIKFMYCILKIQVCKGYIH